MIKIETKPNGVQIEMDGNFAEIMSQLTAIIEGVTEKIAEGTEETPTKVQDDVWDALRFNQLVASGMSNEEAWNIVRPHQKLGE